MAKETVIKGCLSVIKRISEEKELQVTDNGTGHAFDGSFWGGLLTDNSNIHNVVAEGEGYCIELRSFWGNPELDIRRAVRDGEELIVITFSDFANGKRTGDYTVHQIRIDGVHDDYKKALQEAVALVEEITGSN